MRNSWKTAEAEAVLGAETPSFSILNRLKFSRAVFREALRLYPPVPMFVREARCPETFRERPVPKGAQVVISPWHLHRHERIWDNPDGFDPARWESENGKEAQRCAYIPFSTGPRVCPGAGVAMAEGPLLLSLLTRAFRFEVVAGAVPVPVAHLTVRGKDGIRLRLSPREGAPPPRPFGPHPRDIWGNWKRDGQETRSRAALRHLPIAENILGG